MLILVKSSFQFTTFIQSLCGVVHTLNWATKDILYIMYRYFCVNTIFQDSTWYTVLLGPVRTCKNSFANFFVFAKLFDYKARILRIRDYTDVSRDYLRDNEKNFANPFYPVHIGLTKKGRSFRDTVPLMYLFPSPFSSSPSDPSTLQ